MNAFWGFEFPAGRWRGTQELCIKRDINPIQTSYFVASVFDTYSGYSQRQRITKMEESNKNRFQNFKNT